MVQSCIALYNDPLSTHTGDDRIEILSEKLETILVETPVKNNPSDEFLENSQYEVDRIYSLEKKVAALEDELNNKNMVIREQMNVIVNLANSFKNMISNGIQFVYPFV